jgi:methylenetetrahydrofolate reductase (NADPH)
MNDSQPRLSFEFFPARTDEGKQKLLKVRDELNAFEPDFFSVTYGAGGSTRDNTKDLVIQSVQAGVATAPHLSFGGDDEETILKLLSDYKAAGVNRIVALRGDVPSGIGGGFQLVYANELVAFIRKHFGEHFHLEVAAYPEIHPQAKSYSADIGYLKGKFEAGANSAITQYFFNPDSYFYFVDQCQQAGITQPIYPGIMPIINYKNLIRFSDSCGAEIPRWLRKALENYGDDEAGLKAFGVELITDLCDTLLENGAPGLHFYTMNQTEPTAEIVRNLGLVASDE